MEPNVTGERVPTPISDTLLEIEENKSEYRRAKQQFFDRINKEAGLSRGEKASFLPYLKRILDQAEWLLEISYRLMPDEEKKKNRDLLKYFRMFQYGEGKVLELEEKLEEFEDLITPFIDTWKPDKAKIQFDACDWEWPQVKKGSARTEK